MPSVHDYSPRDKTGVPFSLRQLKGWVLIVVNVASRCGLAVSNYRELAQLVDKYDKVKVLLFPCNQFGGQEPGNMCQIESFSQQHSPKFYLFDKIKVNGSDEDPLYAFLKKAQGGILGNAIKWNFTKFVVDPDGNPVHRSNPQTSPRDLEAVIERYIRPT